MSDITRRYKRLAFIFTVLSVLLLFLPLIIFGIKGCLDGTIELTNKLKLGLCFVSALALTVYGVKSRFKCRSITFVLLFGCYFVVKRIEIVVLVSGICCILEEFAVNPLAKYYRQKASINKEIDKRMSDN